MIRAAEIAMSRAYPRPTWRCWHYVKDALVEARVIDSRPASPWAKEAGEELCQRYGFTRLKIKNPMQAPVGAVLVYGGQDAGHVEIQDGNRFCERFYLADSLSEAVSRCICKAHVENLFQWSMRPLASILRQSGNNCVDRSLRYFILRPVSKADVHSYRSNTSFSGHRDFARAAGFAGRTVATYSYSSSLFDERTPQHVGPDLQMIFGPLSGHIRYDARMIAAARIAAERAHRHSTERCWHSVKNALVDAKS